jgi:hypothetical protein
MKGKDLEGSGRGLIEILSRRFVERTEKNKVVLMYSVTQSQIEPRIDNPFRYIIVIISFLRLQ